MLQELSLSTFRNLENLRWQPSKGSHLLLGGNGAGKTSLLEAVYLLSTTRSFRTSRINDCCQHGSSSFSLEGEILGESRVRLETSWKLRSKVRRLNGSEVALAKYLAAQPIVAWTHADADLLSGPPEPRRRFLDRGVMGTQPTALDLFGRYRRVLAHKRHVLQQGPQDLEIWNEMLAPVAFEMTALRARYVTKLARSLEEVLQLCSFPFPAITVHYRPSLNEVQSQEDVLAALRALEGEEKRRQRPLLGPQRDDLEVVWDDHSLRRVASQGERKAIGLALAAAHGKVLEQGGVKPIYLLDDADAELAKDTLEAVWKAFYGVEQVFASSNRPEVWDSIPFAKTWTLRLGQISV
ncbi:MAG: DNA replication and repair protein RecF [Deltaproteobacteria bacterium]|nr:DNA replication and repair protein RecF [Deltaproteobacteria bacterium]